MSINSLAILIFLAQVPHFWGQNWVMYALVGFANVIAGCFGGMAGCAMIGQSVINVKSGGRTRLSTFVAGAFLLFLIIVLGNVVKQIPMAALVGVMIMVSIGTFDWGSLRDMKKLPAGDAVVMIDFGSSHVWDHSAVNAIAKVILKYQQLDKKVTIIGLNEESEMLVERIGSQIVCHQCGTPIPGDVSL